MSKKMREWIVPCKIEGHADYFVEADTEEEAIEKVLALRANSTEDVTFEPKCIDGTPQVIK